MTHCKAAKGRALSSSASARSAVIALLVVCGCSGSVADPSSTSPGGSSSGGGAGADPGSTAGAANAICNPSAPSPGTAPLRRLSNAEYRNSVNDLFSSISDFASVVASATSEFPAEAESLGFRNNAEFLTVQPLLAQKYMDAAEAIAERVAKEPSVVPCTPAAGNEMECGKRFIAEFGKRAYRRPLSAEETARYEAQFRTALTSYDFSTAVEWMIATVLQAPEFLYRLELGVPANRAITRPTSYEMASRLSYLFWQSTPDAALIQAAETGALDTPEQIEAQARRMLADPRSSRLFEYFAEWLDLDRLDDFSRDPKLFTGISPNLGRLFQEETRSFVSSLLSRPDGNFSELLTAPYTYANRELATHYGVASGALPSGAEFVRVDAPQRSGVLTQAMLMAQDKPYRTSIVRRGLKVRTDFLCQLVPAPPNNVQLNLDAIGTNLSQRERLEQHRQDPTCTTCHSRLDPIGVVFESFDAVGRFRTLDELGDPISTLSELTATRDADGPVADVRELGARLAGSAEARECYVTQTFRFFFGRDAESADACSLATLRQAFTEKKLSLSELLIALTRTDAFLYRPTLPEVTP